MANPERDEGVIGALNVAFDLIGVVEPVFGRGLLCGGRGAQREAGEGEGGEGAKHLDLLVLGYRGVVPTLLDEKRSSAAFQTAQNAHISPQKAEWRLCCRADAAGVSTVPS